MNFFRSFNGGMAALAVAAGMLLPSTATAQSTQAAWSDGQWHFGASIYGYLPTIGGSVAFPVGSGGSSINVDANTILDNLKGTFMGSLDAHNGRWGAFTDVLYLNVGGSKSQTRDLSVGNVGLPATTNADLNFDLKGLIWTMAGEYRLMSDPQWTVDFLAGARYASLKPKLSWSFNGDIATLPLPGRSGSKEVSAANWDGIVGLKGRYTFGQNRAWNVPFYADIGTGQSDLTWQAAIGLGYSYRWGDLIAMWRYLDYNFKSGAPIKDMNFNGPMFGVLFRW
jgi:hypothetical protein